MKKQSSFVQLISDLEKNFNINFHSCDFNSELNGKIYALEASKKMNLELIDKEFSEVVKLIQIKLPYIHSLTELNNKLEQQIEELKRQQPPAQQGVDV